MKRRITTGFLCAIFCAGMASAAELAEPLPEILESAQESDWIPVFMVLERQLPRAVVAEMARTLPDKEIRRNRIAERLQQEASRGQAALRSVLESEQGGGGVRNIRTLWLSSIVGAEVQPRVLRMLRTRDDVIQIRHNPKRDVLLEKVPPASRLNLASYPEEEGGTPAAVECGTSLMRAPEVWSEFANTGAGAVIAVIDTGVCYTHPDIRNQIWINPGENLDGDNEVMDADDMNGVDDDGNGFVDDLIGWNFDLGNNDPDDDNSHGSHVAGSVAGDGTSGTQSGLAPDASIMVIRVGTQFSDELDVWNGMQYAAQNGADSISMSLGWPHNQNPDRATWRTNSENTIDMGTAMVIAAGNESGSVSDPDNIRTPGDVPRVISVAAVNCSDVLASFSSIGPVTWQDVPEFGDHAFPPGLVKPDVSGPGVNTQSHNFCSGYSSKSGTSMATPHVAGAVALMVSANPGLSHDDIKQALEDTAVDLGDVGKDNEYGSGRVDAYEAVTLVASTLQYQSHVVDDSDLNYANGDGNVDLNEVAEIRVTLFNTGDVPATRVFASISTTDPSVEIIDGVSFWSDIPAGMTAESDTPHFTIRLNAGCGNIVPFDLAMEHDDGETSKGRFVIRVGGGQTVDFLQDDMETDTGWSTAGTEVDNAFVRDDPNEVILGSGVVAQPEDDVTAAGTDCWVTGNPRTNGSFTPEDGDVDGDAIIQSPIFDATNADGLIVDYSRWVHIANLAFGETSHYSFEVSTNGGGSWLEVERVGLRNGGWETVAIPLGVAGTSQTQVRARMISEGDFGGLGDTILEAAIDDLTVSGTQYVCDSYSEPAASAPNAIGNTVLADRVGATGVRFEWTSPPVDGTHDAASFYQVYRSTSPDSGFAETAMATSPVHADLASMPLGYYLFGASNAGGDSGEIPAP